MATEPTATSTDDACVAYWRTPAENDERQRRELNAAIRAEYLALMDTVTLEETQTEAFGALLDKLFVAEELRSLVRFRAVIARWRAAQRADR